MKFKLDENMSRQCAELFISAGYDAHTVPSEKLSGQPDIEIYQRCCSESRCLVTLDLDFADITRFSPKKCEGIIVVRLHRNSSHAMLLLLINELLDAFKQMRVDHNLWIVESGRIRIHQRDEDE